MLEQILLRIAQRGPRLKSLGEVDSTVSTSSLLPSLPFPAKRSEVQSDTKQPADPLQSWRTAAAASMSGTHPVTNTSAVPLALPPALPPAFPPPFPPAFTNYTRLHAAIGCMIWEERKNIKTRIVHVTAAGALLVAAVDPVKRKAWVRKGVDEHYAKSLAWRELPESAAGFGATLEKEFHESTVYMLLWYCAQLMPNATQFVPSELVSGRMTLRRLPLIDPKGLDLRHLNLIRIFSGGSFTFTELLSLVEQDAKQWLCADIASLYMTGCLVSADT